MKCIDHELVVLVPPELIWQVEIAGWQAITRDHIGWIRYEQVGRRLGRKPDHGHTVLQARIEPPEVAERAGAAQHDVPARRDLESKAEITPPIRTIGEEMREQTMLKIGKPGDRRKRLTPAKEAGGLKYDVDMPHAELCYRTAVEPKYKRVEEL